MKTLVTGGAGFIGSHLVDKLLDYGHEVVVWDSFNTGKKSNLNPKVICYDISVDSISPPQYAYSDYEVIYHLAAEARIQPSFLNPLKVHHSNVTGTVNVLELARLTGARVVFAGSSSVYHDKFANPYSFSKQIAEDYCTLYNQRYNVSVAIARFFNVYGPRQLEEGDYATVIGVFEKQRRDGKPLTITGDGTQRRDFTHVNDIVEGLIGMSHKHWDAIVFDLGTGVNYSINEVAALFNCPVEYIPKRSGEAEVTKANITSSKWLIGYTPTVDLKNYIEG